MAGRDTYRNMHHTVKPCVGVFLNVSLIWQAHFICYLLSLTQTNKGRLDTKFSGTTVSVSHRPHFKTINHGLKVSSSFYPLQHVTANYHTTWDLLKEMMHWWICYIEFSLLGIWSPNFVTLNPALIKPWNFNEIIHVIEKSSFMLIQSDKHLHTPIHKLSCYRYNRTELWLEKLEWRGV